MDCSFGTLFPHFPQLPFRTLFLVAHAWPSKTLDSIGTAPVNGLGREEEDTSERGRMRSGRVQCCCCCLRPSPAVLSLISLLTLCWEDSA